MCIAFELKKEEKNFGRYKMPVNFSIALVECKNHKVVSDNFHYLILRETGNNKLYFNNYGIGNVVLLRYL